MDKDLFIFIRPGHTKTATPSPTPASARQVNTTRPLQNAVMQTGASTNDRQPVQNLAQQPPPRRSRVTIGGSDRQVDDKEASAHGKTRISPPPTILIRREDKAPKPKMGAEPTTGRSTASTTRPSRSPYPPTSWKSTSTIESLRLAPSEHSSVTAPGKLVRTGSRRQYTIGSGTPGRSVPVSPSKDVRVESSPSTDRIELNKAQLPDPKRAYAHTFYYTACPHTSPPKSRPLNVQPALVQNHEGLLAYPPPVIERYRDKPVSIPPNIHILEGPCSDCDLLARRQAEAKILDTYTHKLENLTIQLVLLQRDIVSEHADAVHNQDHEAFTAFTLPSTLELSPEATQGILEIEEQLNELIKKRDHKVHHVWKGFSSRWGPGTVQIQC